MNAGGDIVGKGGVVVKTAEQLDAETEHSIEENMVSNTSIKENPTHNMPNRIIPPQQMDESGTFETPAEAVARLHRENVEEALRSGRKAQLHQENQGDDLFVPVSETISRVAEREPPPQEEPPQEPRRAMRRSRRKTKEDDS